MNYLVGVGARLLAPAYSAILLGCCGLQNSFEPTDSSLMLSTNDIFCPGSGLLIEVRKGSLKRHEPHGEKSHL